MRARWSSLASILVVLPFVSAASAGAQAKARPSTTTPAPKNGRPTDARVPEVAPPAVSAAMLPTTTATAVVVGTASPAPIVVTLPVPDALPARARINYTVQPLIDGAVIGRLTGTLAPATPGEQRTILFAVRTPRQLPAGDAHLATVRFSTQVEAVEVPLIARIAQARDVRIAPTTTLGAAQPGVAHAIAYRVTNMGNGSDSVSVEAILPVGWRIADPVANRPFALPMHASVDRRVEVVPPVHAQGIAAIRLVVLSRGLPVAEARLEVQVVGGPATVGSPGPVLTLGAAAASGPWNEIAHVQTMQLEGQLTDGTMIWARASTAPWRQGAATYALSRANVLSAPPSLQLASKDWRVGLGVLGTTLSDLTGVNLVGQGATISVSQPGWKGSLIAANPSLGFHDATGSLLGGSVEATQGRLTVTSSASQLRESRGQVRALDAVSFGSGWNGILGGRWGGEIARRRFDGDAVSGWSTTWSRRAPGDNMDVRYVHAPGGSRAFARATTELAANGSRRLGDRVNLVGSYWRSTDAGSETLTGLDMRGGSFGTTVSVTHDVSATLLARQSQFGATTAIGDFGSGERAIDATVDGRDGAVHGRLTLTAASLRRTTSVTEDEPEHFAQEAPRYGVRAQLGVGDQRGAITANGQYDRSGAGVGFAPVQWSYGLDVTGAVVPGVEGVRVNGGVERIGGFASGTEQMILRAGLEIDLPLDAMVRISAERNPYLVRDAGEGSWMYVLGVTRSVRLPRLTRSGSRGTVYRDINGNGERDAGEPAFAGVVLRRGSDVAMTDARGAFVLGGNERESFELDARSLPIGWLAHSTLIAAGTREIGVLAVSPVIVDLSLDAADTSRVVAADLKQVVVIATDSTGREWLARRESRTRAIFDALPPGRYTLSVDATAAREPLRPTTDIAPVRITTGRAIPPIRIVLRARSLRFSSSRPGGA